MFIEGSMCGDGRHIEDEGTAGDCSAAISRGSRPRYEHYFCVSRRYVEYEPSAQTNEHSASTVRLQRKENTDNINAGK